MNYDFRKIEAHWQQWWEEKQVYKSEQDSSKPKAYILDMFPYPSGAGLHVGHPLGYIATDIYSRYKRHKGYNVLHPMGFDAFGLPAEQYAIETGQHPAITTENNIATFIGQLKRLGFDYDWNRQVKSCDPKYYRWTQWIFGLLFQHYFDETAQKAKPISELEQRFASEGGPVFSAEQWAQMSEKAQQQILMNYRLAYLDYADVNWCPALGTVLANDEVKDGLSERGGHPVIRKRMRQWFLRITAYAERLLAGFEQIDWPSSMEDMQRNWIGRSEGASCKFSIDGIDEQIEIFTTRPDTMFGATFMVLAPEHELIEKLITADQEKEVRDYLDYVSRRSDLERQSEKTISGVFTGSYAINPLNNKKVPIWTAEYVLAGYGTGAIMAVPSDDERDFNFATKFGLEIIPVVDQSAHPGAERGDKVGVMINSGFMDGMQVLDAISSCIDHLEEKGLGERKVNYRLRDAGYSRQRYWGEPFPIIYKDEMPYLLPEEELPVELPEVESYQPTGDGRSPIAGAEEWLNYSEGIERETDTMPGYAGSSWYWLRYMDPNNSDRFVDPEKEAYWGQVDLYIGGPEHAVGHLMYSRLWNNFLFDLGLVSQAEPFGKLVNQGMIQGRSSLVYRINGTNKFVSAGLRKEHDCTELHVDIKLVKDDVLDTDAFKAWREDYQDAEFILEDGLYRCGSRVEKMSKRWFNVVNPDDVCDQYGADTLRLYEMFLGPLEQGKPWDTSGIDGAHRFLWKIWKLVYDKDGKVQVTNDAPGQDALKVLHKAIKKVSGDIERLSFNTAVSALMVAVNDLNPLKARNREIVEPLLKLLSPFAPHLCEELWHALGHESAIVLEAYPEADEQYLKENEFEYPVSVNGKLRDKVKLSLELSKDEVTAAVLARDSIQKWTEGKEPRKVIVVPGRIVNVVV